MEFPNIGGRAAIHVVATTTPKQDALYGVQPTTAVLQLADRSTATSEGMQDLGCSCIMIMESWEYPVDLMILQPRSK